MVLGRVVERAWNLVLIEGSLWMKGSAVWCLWLFAVGLLLLKLEIRLEAWVGGRSARHLGVVLGVEGRFEQ